MVAQVAHQTPIVGLLLAHQPVLFARRFFVAQLVHGGGHLGKAALGLSTNEFCKQVLARIEALLLELERKVRLGHDHFVEASLLDHLAARVPVGKEAVVLLDLDASKHF